VPKRKSAIRLSKSAQMARVKNRNTDLELLLRRALWATGLRFRVCVKLPGTPDIAFKSARVAIFVDGCFWHGCPIHYRKPSTNVSFWQEKLSNNIFRDRRVDDQLTELGFRVMRFWGHEIIENLEGVVEQICSAVKENDERQKNLPGSTSPKEN
jgi:DNA mismatch endonuclease, patch repair protein